MADHEQAGDGAVACPAERFFEYFEWPGAFAPRELPDAREAIAQRAFEARDYRIDGETLCTLAGYRDSFERVRRAAGIPIGAGWINKLIAFVQAAARNFDAMRQYKQLWLEAWLWAPDVWIEAQVMGQSVACDRCGRPAGLSLRRTKAAVCFRCVSAEDL